MCGRYAATTPRDELAAVYGAVPIGEDLGPRYNVAPTDPVDVILERHEDEQIVRQVRTARWGLVPSWTKTLTGPPLINARVETIDVRPAWRTAYKRRRAIVPAAGYYEWTSEPDPTTGKPIKQPYFLHAAGPLSFAALYELWPDPAKPEDDPTRWLWSAAIITCAAVGPAGEIHDRTPVILATDQIDAWLDPTRPAPHLDLTPPLLGIRAVSRLVNKVGNDGPELIAPLEEHVDEPLQLTLAS